jgi:hypothetical protein
MASLAQ